MIFNDIINNKNSFILNEKIMDVKQIDKIFTAAETIAKSEGNLSPTGEFIDKYGPLLKNIQDKSITLYQIGKQKAEPIYKKQKDVIRKLLIQANKSSAPTLNATKTFLVKEYKTKIKPILKTFFSYQEITRINDILTDWIDNLKSSNNSYYNFMISIFTILSNMVNKIKIVGRYIIMFIKAVKDELKDMIFEHSVHLNESASKFISAAKSAASGFDKMLQKQINKSVNEFVNRITKKKLFKIWKNSGSPKDLYSILNILRSVGFSDNQIDKISKDSKSHLITQKIVDKTNITNLAQKIKQYGLSDRVRNYILSNFDAEASQVKYIPQGGGKQSTPSQTTSAANRRKVRSQANVASTNQNQAPVKVKP